MKERRIIENNTDLSDLCVNTTRDLRKTYYKNSDIQYNCDRIPFGGSIRESIGPFPEFILKGRFCSRSAKGYCTPCFYSRLPEHEIPNQQYNEGYIEQVDHILENFDQLVVANQAGPVAFPKESVQQVYAMVCTPTGSYFDEIEYPVEIRKQILRNILETSVSRNCLIALHIESHAEDVVNYFKSPDEEELDLLRKLNARVMLGFESIDDITRNVIYAKHLDIKMFESAVDDLKANDFGVGAFVFAGLFSMTEDETVADTTKSFEYLKRIGVSPVIMFANTQRYTIPDVLMNIGEYKLLDPRTLLRIIRNMINIFGNNMKGKIDPWFIADPKGGPPDPIRHIFNSIDRTSCNDCSQEVYEIIENLRVSKDANSFEQACERIDACKCAHKYGALLETQKKKQEIGRFDRILHSVLKARMNEEYYVLKVNPWRVKAELLCYGLKLNESQMSNAEKCNPYIREKGLVHAVHIRYENVLVNVCVADSFCQKSPYSAVFTANQWHLIKDNRDLGTFEFISMPDWVFEQVDGKLVGDLVRPHSDNCLSLWPSKRCSYIEKGKGCQYCSLFSPCENEFAKIEEVVNAFEVIMPHNPNYEINLSGGVCDTPDQTIDYYAEISRRLCAKYGDLSISVECVPPSSYEKLHELRESGVSSVIMNIEIYDAQLRRTICPGKSEVSIDEYLNALQTAVGIFGKGNVSSVLIVGIQPADDVKNACETLVSLGVVPTLMPFKPLDNSPMESHMTANPEEYIYLSRFLADIMKKNDMGINANSGCASCGACSLETNLCEVKK